MNLKADRLTPTQLLVLFCSMVLVFLFSMHYRLGAELADDGAFFLRYSENMLQGQFWVWNLGEAPVWGASAPLYPVIVAIPMALGVSPEASIIGVSMGLSAVSLAAVALMLGQRFGAITGLAFFAFSALDTGIMYFAGSGLESPLTIAILAFALWTLLYRTDAWVIGIAAGLLMVNKLDLVPVGGLLLLAHWYQDKRFPKVALIVTAVIAAAWYAYAWLHFGAPVPNSFLTKSLHQNFVSSINWTWFGNFVLWVGIHKWMVGLTALAIWRKGRALLPLLILLGGMLLVHLTAYTIKYPFEPYNWYGMPSLFALLVTGAVGLGCVADAVQRWFPKKTVLAASAALLALAVLFGVSYKMEMLGTSNIKMFASHHEFDRAEAGRWVDANTPKDFVVFTMWGNPAYYSERKVLDGSFLNRKFEEADLIKKYRPEILILQNNPGSTPMNPVFASTKGEDYKVVKVFDKTYTAGMDYFFAVLARKDVIEKVRNIDPPRDLMASVRDVALGDQFGILKPQGLATLFIHPGASTPTAFTFAAKEYLDPDEKKTLSIQGRIDPNIPAEAVSRGAGNVRVRVSQGDKQLFDDVVKVGQPMLRNLFYTGAAPLQISVDNNGGADSDWLLLSIH